MEYRDWLIERRQELQDCIQDAENMGMHHSPVGSPEGDHINNLISLEVKIGSQIAKFPQVLQSARLLPPDSMVQRFDRSE